MNSDLREKIGKCVVLFVKISLLLFSSLVWFVLVQAEYEVVTKPYLRDDISWIDEDLIVYLFGLILIILAFIIIFLIYLLKREIKWLIDRIRKVFRLLP